MLAWRLLGSFPGASGGPSTPVTPAEPFTITAAPKGGWQQYPQPSAFYYNGKTYIAYVKGGSGSIAIVAWDHVTGSTSAEFILTTFAPDTHAAPAVFLRASDHKVMTYFSAHNGAQMYQKISTSPESVAAFDARVNLDSQLGGTQYTYPFIAELPSELFLSYRPHPGGSGHADQAWYFSTSTDDGATWAAGTSWFKQPSRGAYARPSQTSSSRVDFLVEDGEPGSQTNISIRHCYYSGGDFYTTDGTLISAGMPFDKDDLTLVYGGTGFVCRGGEVVLNSSGEPRAVIQDLANGDSSYLYARWTAADGWETFEITDDAEDGAGLGTGGATLDPQHPEIVYLSKVVGSKMEIWKYETADDGETWAGVAVTESSTVDNIYPHVPRNRDDDLVVVWLAGVFNSSTSWSLGIRGAAG